jgi:hypothetical protein
MACGWRVWWRPAWPRDNYAPARGAFLPAVLVDALIGERWGIGVFGTPISRRRAELRQPARRGTRLCGDPKAPHKRSPTRRWRPNYVRAAEALSAPTPRQPRLTAGRS